MKNKCTVIVVVVVVVAVVVISWTLKVKCGHMVFHTQITTHKTEENILCGEIRVGIYRQLAHLTLLWNSSWSWLSPLEFVLIVTVSFGIRADRDCLLLEFVLIVTVLILAVSFGALGFKAHMLKLSLLYLSILFVSFLAPVLSFESFDCLSSINWTNLDCLPPTMLANLDCLMSSF